MDFSTEELTQQVGRTARDFANKSIRPHVMEWDEKQEFPHELFRELGRLGMMGVVVPEAYGGSGLSYTEYVTIIVEISKVCGGIGLSLAAHNSLCTGHILSLGLGRAEIEISARACFGGEAWRLGADRSRDRQRCRQYALYRR